MTYSYCKYNVISIMWECMGMYGIGSSIISVVWYEQSISKYLMHFVRWKAFETCWDDQQAVLFIFAITQGVHQRWIAASNGRAWNAAEPEFWLKIFNKWQPSFFISNYNHQQINRWLSQCNHIISQSIAFISHGDDSPASWKMLEKPAISESAGGLFASSSNHSRKGLKGRLFKLGAPLSLWNPRRNAKSASWVCKANGQNSSAFIAITNSPYTKWYWYIYIYMYMYIIVYTIIYIYIYLETQKSTKTQDMKKNTRFFHKTYKTRCFQIWKSNNFPETIHKLSRPRTSPSRSCAVWGSPPGVAQ